MTFPMTPKMYRQHLDYLKAKSGLSSPTPQPSMTDHINNSVVATPVPYTTPPPVIPSPGLKRKADFTHPDEPVSKRDHVWAEDYHNAVKRMFVPIISRRETSAQLSLQRDQIYYEAGATADNDDSEDNFVDAEEDVADYGATKAGTEDARPAGVETPSVRMDGVNEYGLSVQRSDIMEPPSTLMTSQVEDDMMSMSLFPELGNMRSCEFDEEGPGFAEPEYGQEGIDDGGVVHLDADGLPEMGVQVTERPAEQPAHDANIEGDFTQPQITYNFDDDADDSPDMDALSVKATSTQSHRTPVQEECDSEESAEAEQLSQPEPPVRSDDPQGVHKLVTADGKVDQFMVETGATPGGDQQSSIYERPHPFPSAHDLQGEGRRREQVKQSAQNMQPRDAHGLFSPINYSPNQVAIDDDDVKILGENDSALIQFFNAQGYRYQLPHKRSNTPPLSDNPPEGISPKSLTANGPLLPSGEVYNVSKTSASTAIQRAAELAHLNGTSGPIIPRDCIRALRKYYEIHSRVLHLVPQLLNNYKTFPWHRRYWIAVLHTTKTHKTAASPKEKDFMWMKGNKFSTISTIWHNYALRTMEEDFVLMCRGEICDMKDQVQELDWFDSKLVVLRAVKGESRAFELLGGEGMESPIWRDVGVVPESMAETITIDGE